MRIPVLPLCFDVLHFDLCLCYAVMRADKCNNGRKGADPEGRDGLKQAEERPEADSQDAELLLCRAEEPPLIHALGSCARGKHLAQVVQDLCVADQRGLSHDQRGHAVLFVPLHLLVDGIEEPPLVYAVDVVYPELQAQAAVLCHLCEDGSDARAVRAPWAHEVIYASGSSSGGSVCCICARCS